MALNFGVHLDHACGGNCACTTCHVWVKEGAELVSEMEDDEADKLDMAADLQLNSRLGCQAVIKKPGKVVVEIPAWNRNYVRKNTENLFSIVGHPFSVFAESEFTWSFPPCLKNLPGATRRILESCCRRCILKLIRWRCALRTCIGM